jgi:SecD/SecF fusion protein
MISRAAVLKPLNGDTFEITGSFTSDEAMNLSSKINFGTSRYSLDKISSHFTNAEYGDDAFKNAVLAGIVVFSLIAIFMMVNYGLLGALSTISISLYIFLTLALFTSMRGEYSPETIAALIVGVGMSVDANIITFERLKTEVYAGNSIKKSFKSANRMSLSTIFDSNITTIIVGFVLFFFGSSSIRGFAVMLIISILFTLLIILLFTRLVANLLVKTNVFENRPYLLGSHAKYIGNINHQSK